MKLLHVIANNFKNCNDSFEIDFYHDGFIYRYETILKNADSIASKAIFMKQRLRKKKYYKSKVKALYNDEDFVDVEITGENYLEIGQETDLAYAVYPKRVAESSNLYITWGMVTGEDKDGNTTYSWATADTPATDGRGQIDSAGHYSVVSGGQSVVVLKAQTGYYLSNNNFYEISSKTATFDMSNGIPVENITINVDSALGIAGKINKTTDVTVGDRTYKYVSINAGTQYAGLGAKLTATVEPETASNKNLTWVVDNGYYSQKLSDDTHTAEITQKAGHENADTFNVYAVSADECRRLNGE